MISQELAHILPEPDSADADFEKLKEGYERLLRSSFFVEIAKKDPLTNYRLLSGLSRHSGALAFVALQQSVAMLYPGVKATDRTGVAIGHLRDPSKQLLRSVDGKVVSGFVPWFTGAGLFEQAVLGFIDQHGGESFSVVSTKNRPEFDHGEPARLVACSSTNTLSVQVNRLTLEQIIKSQPLGKKLQNDREHLVWQTPLMAGAILACLEWVKRADWETRLKEAIVVTATSLVDALENAATREVSIEEGLGWRTRAGTACIKMARIAAMAAGGKSLVIGHPVERLYRECLVYNLLAQNLEIAEHAAGSEAL